MRAETGAAGERAAWEAYRRRGYRLVARNWRCRLGELDLVLTRDGILVFCEVKARRSRTVADPFQAVTPIKQQKVRTVAQAFLAGVDGDPACRFDVASVWVDGRGNADVRVFEDAF